MGLESGAGLEGDFDAGERVETIEEGWVEGEAEIGEWAQRRGIVGVAGGEHSGGGGGGFGEGLSLLEDGHAEAAMVEFEGEREADDACACDADIGVMHTSSLVRFTKEVWSADRKFERLTSSLFRNSRCR